MSEDNECVSCWSCGNIVEIRDIKYNDGFCPCCNNEIDLNEDNK